MPDPAPAGIAGAEASVLTVAQMVAAEQRLIERGETVDTLMQRAGRGAAEWVRRVAAGGPVTVLCGPGNNGGDGYVIAEALRERGGRAAVVAALPPATDAARRAAALCRGQSVAAADAKGAVLVDCLFGSGLNRRLEPALSAMLRGLAGRHSRSIAIDMPSGIDSDTGALLADRLPRYDLALALGAYKRAHFLMPAMAHWRDLRLVGIGIETGDVGEGAARLVTRPALSPPPRDAHKYRRGLAAVVGGAMPGAGLLAARAAALAGAGYVKLLARRAIHSAPPDLVVLDAPAGESLGESLGDGRLGALLVGPGLGRDAEAGGRLAQALAAGVACVADADALVLLRPAMVRGRDRPLVLTPHEGELARLEASFDLPGEGARPARAQALARESGALVVAKGPDTLVADPGGGLAFAGPAPSWLSVAGSGDVLAGIIAARLAVTGDAAAAAHQALWLHAEAAAIAGPAFTAAMLAEAVRDALAAATGAAP